MYFSKTKLWEREREMALPHRMSLRPGLLWLTANLVLITQGLSRNNNSFSILYTQYDIFSYSLRCLRLLLGVHVSHVEDHWSTRLSTYHVLPLSQWTQLQDSQRSETFKCGHTSCGNCNLGWFFRRGPAEIKWTGLTLNWLILTSYSYCDQLLTELLQGKISTWHSAGEGHFLVTEPQEDYSCTLLSTQGASD
jgi:hypothetical protein